MKKRNLYIIGAGGFGREVESWIKDIPIEKRDWEFKGFLDSVKDIGSLTYPSDYLIVGNERTFKFNKSDYVILAFADANMREEAYEFLKDKVSFYSFISPKAIIGKFCEIGEGAIICPNVVITTNVKIGKLCIINAGSQIGHDTSLGSYCSLMGNVDITGNCIIGDKVYFGTGSTVIPSRKIANQTKVGAGSVVLRNISKEGKTIFGNPAQYL